MNLDITYCSKKDCNNLECERNQQHLNKILIGNHPISISENTDCKYWRNKNELLCKKKSSKV